MASATVDSAAAASTADGGFLRLDSIPIVDLRLLSQTELYSLSRCSSSASDPNRRDDVVIPIIDRSVFNESAGSRKQTYSRVRLAPADSSSSATPRGRTGHLRSAAAAYGAINRRSDPENVENNQIINLLKQFFIGDMNPADLFPVKIEYSNSLPVQQLTTLPPPPSPPSNAGPTVLKRKRGRPRKNEFIGNGESLAVEVSVIDGSGVGRDRPAPMPSLNVLVARGNEEEDREVLNSNGVAVDLAALSAVEHPYWDEIRRRTEGLRTEEQLLGFLAGLNGRWGSRRKKKRIVDANEFGSQLPVGWKLLLSVKKKSGHVWLHCRRYISPSGLHFISCKGVSSYLLSLHGMEDNPYSCAQYNDIGIDADGLTSVPLAIRDDQELENLISQSSLPLLDSVTGNHETRVDVGNQVEDRIGESLCCNKCNITFNNKDEYLHHQSSLHRKSRNKNVTRITDGVIIKDGKYECQFCHKTFSERHRYNGHVGTHVRFQARITGELSQSVVQPTSLNGYPTKDIVMEGSSQSPNAVEVCNSITNIGSHGDKCDDHFGDLEDASENVGGMDKATDIVIETSHCSVPEVLLSSNANKSLHEDACLDESAAELSKDSSILQEGKMLESSLSHNDAAHIDMNNNVTEISEKPEQIPKSPLLDSNDPLEECPLENNGQHRDNNDRSNQKPNELVADAQKLAVNESVFDLFGTQEDQEKDLAVTTKEKSVFEYLLCKDIGTTESISTFGSEASKLENEEKACQEENVPNSTVNCQVGETLKCEDESSMADNEGTIRHEEMQFEMASVLQSWDEQENVTKKDDTEVLGHLADNENIYHYENNDGGVRRREAKILEFDSLQDFENGQSSDLFSSSPATKLDTRLGVSSPFTSTTKQLSAEDDMISVFDNTMEEHRQDPSADILLNNSGISEVPNEAFRSNKIYTPNPSELDGIENAGKHELSLSFGSLQTDSFNIESVVQKTYGGPTHPSILSSSIAADLEQGRPFEYSNISFNDTTHEPGSSFNVDWDGTRNKARTSSQNFMAGFVNNSLQTSACAVADDSWRTSRDNVFGGCYGATNSGPPIPSSSFFPSFGLAPNKVQESSFGVNQNYGSQSDMMRQGRSQPVEYSFMGEQRVNSLHEEPKIFQYATNMEQGMHPSFWLGNDALKPNASHPIQPTSVCVYCRNLFFNQPIQAGVQTASICPSCSSSFPGQFNSL